MVMIGAVVNQYLRSQKATSATGDQIKGTKGEVSLVKVLLLSCSEPAIKSGKSKEPLEMLTELGVGHSATFEDLPRFARS